ncbi:MAG: hypothetical protein ACLQT6_13780 [Desulfomonilaceae bacterium]
MKPKLHLPTAVLPIALFVIVCFSLFPTPSYSQSLASWFSNGTFWDWSDYRFKFEYRLFAPRLVSGYIKRPDYANQNSQLKEFDLLASPSGDGDQSRSGGYGFNQYPQAFRSAAFQLYVDRLAFRLVVDEDVIFRGTLGNTVFADMPATFFVSTSGYQPHTGSNNYFRVSELDLSSTRLGMGLDLVRNPYLRAGIDFDFYINQVTFRDMKDAVTTSSIGSPGPPSSPYLSYYLENMRYYKSDNGPCTIGLHVFAIPGRIREIPIIAQAKINVSTPFWKQIWGIQNLAQIFEWEVMAGARPAIWDASAFGLTTFSFGIEAGFKSVTLNSDMSGSMAAGSSFPGPATVHAVWQGPFFQAGFYY